MSTTWKLQWDDSSVDEFTDIRRKVGNQVIRAYLLDSVLASKKIERMNGKLRGPKNEFKDFAKFLILRVSIDGLSARFLAEAGVYENLRIVAVDPIKIAERESEDLIKLFTDALADLDSYDTTLVLSDDSMVR
ncbi:MAG: hypothetical protein ACW98U_02445 [Candidatus Thorarchaeota archaeon]|jgi:hypothetical protein